MQSYKDQFYIVPGSVLEKILESQSKILDLLSGQSSSVGKPPLGDYISEPEAKGLLGRKTTWFWNMRQSGQLPFSKIGSTNYYSRQDILNILNANHSSEK